MLKAKCIPMKTVAATLRCLRTHLLLERCDQVFVDGRSPHTTLRQPRTYQQANLQQGHHITAHKLPPTVLRLVLTPLHMQSKLPLAVLAFVLCS
jgi:hypothetical protein